MVLNLFVAIFVLLMVYWWSEQGLFSAFIHLLVTIVAGVLAIALWEPLAVGFLLDRMPEYAWGTALLAVFTLAMFGGRYATDKLVPENLSFHNLADRFGGAALGLASGVLTAGLLVIGLQMTGMPDLFGYQPYSLDDRQQAVREDSLWIPVDDIAGDFFIRLASGSMAPIGGEPANQFYRGFGVEAGLFNTAAFADSRRAMVFDDLALIAEEPLYVIDTVPQGFGDLVTLTPDDRLVIVGSEIALQGSGGAGAADGDSVFRAAPHQVALAYEPANDDASEFAHPVGIIQRGQFGSLTAEGSYATSGGGDRVQHHWVFRVPADAEPLFLRVKNARVPVPDERVDQVSAVNRLINIRQPTGGGGGEGEDGGGGSQPPGNRPPGGGPTGPPQSRSGGDASAGDDDLAVVSDMLPRVMSRSDLERQNVRVNGNALVSGEGNVETAGRVGRNLAVDRIHHPASLRIVQVRLGAREANSRLGRIIARATNAPILTDQSGSQYTAIGYVISGSSSTRFRIDPIRPVRALSELNLGNVREGEQVTLIYQVDAGTRLTELVMGNDSQVLAVDVPR